MGKGKGGSKGAAPTEEGMDPVVLLKNYQTICKSIGTKVEPAIVAIINCDNDENLNAPEQISVDIELGPAGVRAIVEALLGLIDKSGASTAYTQITAMRFWRSRIGNEGVITLSKYLHKSGPESKLKLLEVLDDTVGASGCAKLGDALSIGMNKSLVNLRLDHNAYLGSDGVKALCRGLRSNRTLKKLSLSYCNIGPEGGKPLGNVIRYKDSSIEEINLHGNELRGDGVAEVFTALEKNTCLRVLDVGDNVVGQDIGSLQVLCEMLKVNNTINHIEFAHNGIGNEGAQLLVDSGVFAKGVPSNLHHFTVDTDINSELFEQLIRMGAAGGKKKGKKGKGKKKKK